MAGITYSQNTLALISERFVFKNNQYLLNEKWSEIRCKASQHNS